jgi:glutamine---fructose-6-phosphate transaminase (isomerizing)
MPKYRMLDFIREQPEALANTLRQVRNRVPELQELIGSRAFEQVIIAGLGSSYTAAQMASPLLRRCLPVPASVTVATELGLDQGLALGPKTLVLLVSRSGERGRILDAQNVAKQAGAVTVAVTAVESSLLAAEAELVLVTGEGPESSYAKTKSVTASAAALMQVGVALDGQEGDEARQLADALAEMPALVADGIDEAEQGLGLLDEWLRRYELMLVTGTAGNQGVAQEGALKLQEAAGVVTEWDETGSALHGAVTILGPAWLYIALVTTADRELNRSVLQLAHEFGAGRLCIAEQGAALDGSAGEIISIPQAGHALVAPLLFLPPIQLLTYQMAIGRGRNSDEPAFADVMLKAMLPPGRDEPDWRAAAAPPGN